jgi:hypothetical protein
MQKIEELRSRVDKLSLDLNTMQENNRSLSDELRERNNENAVLTANESKVSFAVVSFFLNFFTILVFLLSRLKAS